MKYTRGKWKAYKGRYHYTIDAGRPFANNVIAKVPYSEANARLIAAAPDMYEALKDICDFLKANGYRTDIVKEALAKVDKQISFGV